MTPKFIQIGPQKIAYYESPGSGPTVVMLHGNSLSSLSFQKQLESPLGERYRLIAIDLPGHGMSDKAGDPKVSYTIPGYAEILTKTVESLNLSNAVFVAFSLGGNILLETAKRLPSKGSLIVGSAPVADASSIQEAFYPNQALSICFKGELTDEEIDIYLSAMLTEGAVIPKFFRDDVVRSDKAVRQTLGESIVPGGFRDEVKILADLKIPIAIVLGEKDGYVRKSYLDALNIPTLWRGGIQVIPDAGHTPQWEQPERFNSLLGEFILDVT